MRTVPRHHEAVVADLVRRHQASVRGFLVFLGCPRRILDDLVQDVFLSVLSSRFEDRGEASTAAFLRTVARNLLLKALRRDEPEPLPADWVDLEVAWSEYQGDDQGRGYLEALRGCLVELRPRARQVVELRYGSSLAREAIAARLGMSDSGVKSLLVRTRKRLRECVERRRSR